MNARKTACKLGKQAVSSRVGAVAEKDKSKLGPRHGAARVLAAGEGRRTPQMAGFVCSYSQKIGSCAFSSVARAVHIDEIDGRQYHPPIHIPNILRKYSKRRNIPLQNYIRRTVAIADGAST